MKIIDFYKAIAPGLYRVILGDYLSELEDRIAIPEEIRFATMLEF